MSNATVSMGPAQPIIPVQFESKAQHNECNIIGMWLFIAQEIMFFGGLFTAYGIYRFKYPHVWAEAASHLDVTLGALNTFFLLISSLTMALAVYFTQKDRFMPVIICFSITITLGIAFLVVKYFEYGQKFEHNLVPGLDWGPEWAGMPNMKLFFTFYFVMTGMHAFHMIIGIAIAAVMMVMIIKRKFGPNRYMPMEIFGFYWHFVDIVWVFLFPMIYLIPHPV